MSDENRKDGRGLIGRRPCGCVVAVHIGFTAADRRRMQGQGYTVSEHPALEAADLFRAQAVSDCGHGTTTEQLVRQLEEARAALRATCAIIGSPGKQTRATNDQINAAWERAQRVLGDEVNSEGREGAK